MYLIYTTYTEIELQESRAGWSRILHEGANKMGKLACLHVLSTYKWEEVPGLATTYEVI